MAETTLDTYTNVDCEIKKLAPQPGEIIVISHEPCSREQHEHLHRCAGQTAQLVGVPVLIMPRAVDIAVGGSQQRLLAALNTSGALKPLLSALCSVHGQSVSYFLKTTETGGGPHHHNRLALRSLAKVKSLLAEIGFFQNDDHQLKEVSDEGV